MRKSGKVILLLIEKLEIKNFRSIKDSVLDCNNLTVLVGRNGSGKSCFLAAINIFYDLSAKVTEEDFFNRDREHPIEIKITFRDLLPSERTDFQAYLKNDKLIVTKRIALENETITQRYYSEFLQIPQFAQIRSISAKRERIDAFKELVESGELSGLIGNPRSAEAAEELMTEYEKTHRTLLVPVEREGQFFGATHVGGGKLDKCTKFVLLPAVKEASEEVTGRKGAIYQLLDMIVLRKLEERQDLRDFRTDYEEKIRKLYSSENLRELLELGDSISKTLEVFAPRSKLKLDWQEIVPPEIQPPGVKATLVEDEFEGDIDKKGHGLQRALVLTLLEHLALTQPLETPENAQESSESLQGLDLILAIEEPELYLHPSRCRYLSRLLEQLAESSEIHLGSHTQVIYSTHSPHFVDLHRFDNIRLTRKETGDGPIAYTVVNSYTLDQARARYAEVLGKNPEDITRQGFKIRSLPVMNAIVNEGFFADVVVLVEGVSDAAMLWKIQERLGKKWEQLGFAVIPVEGKGNITRPVIIFEGLKIPTYFVFDADVTNARLNRQLLRLKGATEVDFPDTQVHDTWAVIKENPEQLCESILGKSVCEEIWKCVGDELECNPSKLKKNLDTVMRFVELVYEKGKSLPVFEEIVNKISRMAS